MVARGKRIATNPLRSEGRVVGEEGRTRNECGEMARSGGEMARREMARRGAFSTGFLLAIQ